MDLIEWLHIDEHVIWNPCKEILEHLLLCQNHVSVNLFSLAERPIVPWWTSSPPPILPPGIDESQFGAYLGRNRQGIVRKEDIINPKWFIIFLCEDGNSNNEEGFDHPPSSSSEESASDEEEESDADDSEGTLNNIVNKLNSAGINVSRVIWKIK